MDPKDSQIQPTPPSFTLQEEWVRIMDKNFIAVNVRNAAGQGIDWDLDSGVYVFNNATRTKEMGTSKAFGLMDQVCDAVNKHLGYKAFLASYQGPFGVTLVTDGKTLKALADSPLGKHLSLPKADIPALK